MAEKQTCPRRMGEVGPWQRGEGLDLWETDRWFSDPADVAAEIKRHDDMGRASAEKGGYPYSPTHWGQYSFAWLWPGPVVVFPLRPLHLRHLRGGDGGQRGLQAVQTDRGRSS